MIAHLKPYPATKDSGVEWLGEVPAHWEVRRMRNVSQLRVSNVDKHSKEGEAPVRLCNYVDVYKNDHIRSGMAFMASTAKADEFDRFRLCSGDVLITKDSEAWNDIGVPALVQNVDADVVSGYHLALLRPDTKQLEGTFLFRAMQSRGVAHQFHVEAKGVTRYGLSHDAIKSVQLPVPPLPEQTAIARFLDHSDRRIQRYIRAKEILIALLEEQKQAIIHQAVTGQIGVCTGQPYPAYKPSGVEWLGMVPEHWDVAALRHRYDQRLGKMLDTKRITGQHLVPYLRNVDVQWDHINLSNLPLMDILPREFERYTVQPGDLLVCEGGEVGRCAIWNGEMKLCAYQKALHQLRPFCADLDRPRFLLYVLRLAAAKDAFNDGQESTIGHLTGEKLRCHRLVFPPVKEQRGIVRYLDAACSRIDGAVFRAQREIELVREYRTRLIADVVTGKLDVREAAAALPEGDPLAVVDEVDDSSDKGGLPALDHEDQPAEVAG